MQWAVSVYLCNTPVKENNLFLKIYLKSQRTTMLNLYNENWKHK